jgi:hypothetical protein
MEMEHRQNDNIFWPLDEIDPIGKMTEKGSADFSFQLRKLFRIVFDTPEDFVEFVQEPHA